MTISISERLRRAIGVLNGRIDLDQVIPMTGLFIAEVTRADGTRERKIIRNIVTRQGLNRIANRAVAYSTSAAAYLAIGTQTAAHSLDSVQAGLGEVGRKIAASAVQSREWFSCVATWAGNADGLTSVVLDSCAISDFANSHASTGICFNMANGLGVTLAASDFLNLTAQIRCGSHNLSHST